MPLPTPPQSLLSTLYALLLPTIFLNPVLFLHSLNTILTRLLPSLDGYEGNSAQPHLDIHASESLCWSYTFLIVWAQMAAFLRLEREREREKQGGGARKGKGKRKGGCEREHRREDSGCSLELLHLRHAYYGAGGCSLRCGKGDIELALLKRWLPDRTPTVQNNAAVENER